jgi:tetratricopeptide (TPR) repeat protein
VQLSVALLRKLLGAEHTDYIRSVNLLGALRFGSNDMAGAVQAAQEVVNAIGRSVHESEPAAASALQLLGLALDSLGQHHAADSALRRSLELRRKYLPADHWAIASSESIVGYHLGRVGRHEEGERIMRDAYAKLAEARGADSQVAKRLAERLAELLERMGHTSDAEEWRARS